MSNKKRTPAHDEHRLPEELDDYLKKLAKEAAGKELDMSASSPLKQLIGRFVEVALEEEMREHLGYDRYEREPSTKRKNTRNGHSGKRLKTTHGEAEIKVPRDREGSYEPQLVPKYKTITREVESRIIAMYASGMTTREIQRHVEELYAYSASEMFVTRIVERLDPELRAWRSRPLEQIYGVVYVDALHLKVRHAHGVRSTAVYLVSGYGEDGIMQLLGLYMAPSGPQTGEAASFWHQVLVELEGRGAKKILVLCADSLTGLEEAVSSVYPETVFQPCVVHLMRSSLRHVRWPDRKEVARWLKRIYQAPTYEAAEDALSDADERYGIRYPATIRQWTKALPLLASLWQFSPLLRKLVYTINPIENINRQFRKVTKNRGVLPNTESALRLMTLVAQRIDKRHRTRPDWARIVGELTLVFADQLPDGWGFRH